MECVSVGHIVSGLSRREIWVARWHGEEGDSNAGFTSKGGADLLKFFLELGKFQTSETSALKTLGKLLLNVIIFTKLS